MTHLIERLKSADRPVLISIHPQYADAIVAGTKRVEFRRRWSATGSDIAVIYATAPTKAVVAIVEIKEVARHSKSKLWELAKLLGGGITRRKLFEYMTGLSGGFALKLGPLLNLKFEPIDPNLFAESFRPPQSFRYLRPGEVSLLAEAISGRA